MISVFIVEDKPSIQIFFKKVLTLNGFEVAGIAKNGKEAVLMFQSFEEKPDIILMDYRMPVKNGIEASREILQINAQTKIIFTTADNSIKEEANSIGIDSFLDKPFTIKQLISNIEKTITPF